MYELKPNNRRATDGEIIADLRRVAALTGSKPLTREAYGREGRFNSSTVANRFGGWGKALQRANMKQARCIGISREEYLADMQEVAKRLRTAALSKRDYEKNGRYSDKHLYRLFESWTDALTQARLQPAAAHHERISDDDLFDDIERLWQSLGRQPKSTEVGAPRTQFSLGAFKNRFGGWRRALEAFVQAVSDDHLPREESAVPLEPLTHHEYQPVSHKTSRSVSWRLRYIVMRRNRFCCVKCGHSPATHPGTILVIDHKIPWSSGGETEIGNLQTLCQVCNAGKSNLADSLFDSVV